MGEKMQELSKWDKYDLNSRDFVYYEEKNPHNSGKEVVEFPI